MTTIQSKGQQWREFKRQMLDLFWPAPGLIAGLLRGLANLFRSRKPPAPAPDPFRDLPHAGNRELFAAFKPFYSPDAYNAHPDLGVRLYELEPREKVIRATAYGFPVIANPSGLVFAWARGWDSIYLKLGAEHHEAARQERGKPNLEYGKDWIRFPAWVAPSKDALPPPSTEQEKANEKKRTEWEASLRRWMQIAYSDSMQ